MWLRVSCKVEMDFAVESPMILMLRPSSDARQWVARDHYGVSPAMPITEYTDIYGNRCQRLLAAPGRFELEVSSDVKILHVSDPCHDAGYVPVQDLPDETLMYLVPSRYCESDKLATLAGEIVADCTPGYEQVRAISDWIHQTLVYRSDSDPAPVSAAEVLARGDGVCRDFAHLGIALCRSLSIPARMIVGYRHKLEPMDLHAWFEVFVGGRWCPLDPTQKTMSGARVSLARGRDAADVPVFTQFGPSVIPSRMEVSVEEIQGDP